MINLPEDTSQFEVVDEAKPKSIAECLSLLRKILQQLAKNNALRI